MKIFLCNLFIFVIGVVLVELAFGSWFSSHRMNRLNVIRSTTVPYDVQHLYPHPVKTVIYRRDQFGFRGEYKNPALIDILTVGGSTTDQRYVSEGFTWQDVLHKDFLAQGKWVSVVNAGVDGQSTFGHLKAFEWWFPEIPGLKVKYFLFYIGINDFHKDAGYKFDDLIVSYVPFRKILSERSALAYMWRTLKGIYRAKTEKAESRLVDYKKIKWTETGNISDYENFTRGRLDDYEKRLRMLVAKVRAWGATPIFVTQNFYSYKKSNGKILGVTDTRTYNGSPVNGVDVYFIMQRLNQRTLQVCRETGGICIDLAGELRLRRQDLYDFVHTTPKGSAKMGHYLHEKLKGYF